MKLLKYAMLPFIALSCFACSDDDESAIKNDMICLLYTSDAADD